MSGLYIVTFSEAAIRRYNALVAMKLNIGRMDLRIAAIALEEDAVVITRNLRDFGRVPGLTCENWADGRDTYGRHTNTAWGAHPDP